MSFLEPSTPIQFYEMKVGRKNATEIFELPPVPESVFANLGPPESCTLVAPAGCLRASERAPEPVPAAGSGFYYRLRPARASAGGRAQDQVRAGGRRGVPRSGSGRRALRALLESSAGAIGSGARPGKPRGVRRSGRQATLQGWWGRERGEGRPSVRVPSARALKPRGSPGERAVRAPDPSRGPRHLAPKQKDFEGKSRSRSPGWRRFHWEQVVTRRT
ncbi:hypothetical protein HispidOSU_019085 [Sigmodon hispidus]